jgi:Rrf2 family protein
MKKSLTFRVQFIIIPTVLVEKEESVILVPQKIQYALRAVFELARQHGRGPVKIAEVARTQAIPMRFLEVILSQLKQGGFVGSQRGSEGGYFIVRDPHDLTIGELMRFLQGPISPVACLTDDPKDRCSLYGECVFLPMWEKVRLAISQVYDNTTFQDLVDQAERKSGKVAPSYAI